MVNKTSTVDEAIASKWNIPDTVLKPSKKQSVNALLREKTDVVVRRHFSAPHPELWVDTLGELLKQTGKVVSLDVCSLCLLRIVMNHANGVTSQLFCASKRFADVSANCLSRLQFRLSTFSLNALQCYFSK